MKTPRKERLRNNAVIGKTVVLVRDAVTKGGTRFKKGQRMRIRSTWRGKFMLYALTPTGRESSRGINQMSWSDFEFEDGTPKTS